MLSVTDNSKNIKVSFERIENDEKYLLAKIMWQADNDIVDGEVYAELAGRKDSLKELKKLDNSNVWVTDYKISNCIPELINADKNVAIKLVQYKVKPKSVGC